MARYHSPLALLYWYFKLQSYWKTYVKKGKGPLIHSKQTLITAQISNPTRLIHNKGNSWLNLTYFSKHSASCLIVWVIHCSCDLLIGQAVKIVYKFYSWLLPYCLCFKILDEGLPKPLYHIDTVALELRNNFWMQNWQENYWLALRYLASFPVSSHKQALCTVVRVIEAVRWCPVAIHTYVFYISKNIYKQSIGVYVIDL